MAGQKTKAKTGRTPAETRRSASKGMKKEAAPATPGPSKTQFSHHLPTNEQRKGNGRVAGRNLIIWGRPRMTDKLLLHIQYECQRAKIDLPWDAIAHRFHPGSSGAAIHQHLARLRRDLVAEGHLVPPPSQSRGAVDSGIRGYVREGDNKEDVRAVSFSETLEDRRFNLPDAHDCEASPSSTGTSDFENALEDCPQTPTPVRHGSRSQVASHPMTGPHVTHDKYHLGKVDMKMNALFGPDDDVPAKGTYHPVRPSTSSQNTSRITLPSTPVSKINHGIALEGQSLPYFGQMSYLSPETMGALPFTPQSSFGTSAYALDPVTPWQQSVQLTPPSSGNSGNYQPTSAPTAMMPSFVSGSECNIESRSQTPPQFPMYDDDENIFTFGDADMF